MSRGPLRLTAAIQLQYLRQIGFHGGLRREELDAQAIVQPTEITDRYLLRLRYRLGTAPEVTVEDPELRPLDDGTPVPHVYPRLRLCLYQPRRGEWGPHLRLSVTIVPWAMEWLYFYEVWHATGTWAGGGSHPRIRSRRRRRLW